MVNGDQQRAATRFGRFGVRLLFLAFVLVCFVSQAAPALPAAMDSTAPSAPTTILVSGVSQTGFAAGWLGASDDVAVVGYDVFLNGVLDRKTTADSASFSALTCSTTYQLGIDAYDQAGNHSPVKTTSVTTAACPGGGDTTPPSAPTTILVSGVSQTGFGAGWLGASDNVAVVGYDAYLNGVLSRTTTADSASFSALTCGTTYQLGIDAYDQAGNHSPVKTTSVTTAACPGGGDTTPPSAPTTVSVSGVSQNGFGASWSGASDNVGVAGYDLLLNGVFSRTTTATSASFSGLTCSTTYQFGVDAYDQAGNHSPVKTTSVTTSACTSPPPPPSPPPAAGSIYWGAYIGARDTYSYLYGGVWSDPPWCDAGTQCGLTRFTQNAGKAPSVEHYGQPPPWDGSLDVGALNLVQSRGDIAAIDMVTSDVTDASIANGTYDTQITAWAQAAKSFGHPFFLLLDEEMNGTWYSFSPGLNGNTAASFVAAWRHMHDIFTNVGATNVTWVWCPNIINPEGGGTPYSQIYPGDAYVDWTGFNGYNWGIPNPGDWQSFSTIFTQSYNALLQVAPSKPIMIGETAAAEENLVGGSKAAWITDALSTQLPQNFPQIKALLWFNWRTNEKGAYRTWEIESSPASQQAFATAVASPYYAPGGSFGSLPLLSKVKPLP